MPTETFSQDDRPLAVTTPLGKDVLLIETVSGTEELSRPFQYELSLLAKEETNVPFEKILGQPMTVTIRGDDGPERYVHGIVTGLAQGEQVQSDGGSTTFTRYFADIAPKIWLLTKVVRNRIFQQKTVPEILTTVFEGYDVSKKIEGTYEPRDYCAQYRESDLDFAQRLMEDEGIYFYFDHTEDKHTLVLGDSPQGHVAIAKSATANFYMEGTSDAGESVMTWTKRQRVRSGKVTLWDYSFEMADRKDHFESVETIAGNVSVGKKSHPRTAGGADKLEQFLTQAGFAARFDGIAPGGAEQASKLAKITPDGRRTAKLRLREETWPGLVVDGVSDVRRLVAGRTFELAGHPHANGKYLLVKIDLAASIEGAYTGGGARPLAFRNHFTAVPGATPFGPARITPKPRAEGLQTAVVVGPAGEEIFTDKYGRIKVQFHWDRDGKNDQDSSCWVRVATTWAGQQWGAIHIPRIGHEVLIGFEEADPDQPICVGSLYNAVNMPPYTLPDNKTKSGIMSRSTTKGDATTFNELRFEDKKGAEEIYFHAERDFLRIVENNDTLKVGFDKKEDGNQLVEIFNNQDIFVGDKKGEAKDGSQKLEVFNTQTIKIGSGQGQAKDGSQKLTVYKDRIATVQTGDDKLTVDKGGRFVTITTGNDEHVIKTGNRTVEIATGNDTLTIKTGNHKTAITAGASKTEAMQSIEFKVGGSTLKLDPSGIQMKGLKINIEGEIMVQMKATIVKVDASGFLILKGGITMIN
ncbi:type VI secretion system Vgr family protein [Limnoglobus roseus]|uniref:Type VI secretion system tip protein VgrG n=1 Tax=Limnoglobus roseus TaxID=2598579 RepID=A0A5C1AJR0_9BACT|nr:type VI secretion system tip protein TssI/VgrG [Limnoglobus roseus]QEL19441.1 type VI secretion system tip protein VgrG [Limnoglobus roseus]